MRYLFSISLSILLLLQTVNLGATDLLRLNELIEHAQLHADNYGDSFFDFLNKHYGSLKKDHLPSHEGHDKLPFHKGTIQVLVCFVLLDISKIPDILIPTFSHPEMSFFYSVCYTSPDNQKIFQPPQYT